MVLILKKKYVIIIYDFVKKQEGRTEICKQGNSNARENC